MTYTLKMFMSLVKSHCNHYLSRGLKPKTVSVLKQKKSEK